MPSLLRAPPRYVLASFLCAFGGLLFGFDTGIIGPVTVMLSFEDKFGRPSATVHGLIVSSILIPAAFSSFLAGRLADSVGRRKAIAIGAGIFGAGAAVEAAAVHLGMFIAGRVVEGAGEGLYLGTLVVYICEISPPARRGALATSPQLLLTVGLVIGYFVCYGTAKMYGDLAWRLPFVLLAVMSGVFTVATLRLLPDSPRWLTLKGRRADAVHAWEQLDVNAADRERIEDEIEMQEGGRANSGIAAAAEPREAGFLAVFGKEGRGRLWLGVFMMAMQQLSGIDGVLYYAPLLFTQAGLASAEASFLASGVSAILILAITIPALIWADSWTRRASTLLGGLGLTATMLIIGSLYASGNVHRDSGAGRWVVIVCIYLFAIIYAGTWGIVVKLYAAEIQQPATRAAATSLAHGSNWVANFFVALMTPILLSRSDFGAYFLFGGCSMLAVVVCFFAMAETRGKSLDDIDAAFRARRIRPLASADAADSVATGVSTAANGQSVEHAAPGGSAWAHAAANIQQVIGRARPVAAKT